MTAPTFESLLTPARPRLSLIALAIVHDRTDAEDVLQDACITGLAKYRAGEFTPGSNFDAWMGQIVRYTALNARRSRRHAPTTMTDQTRQHAASPPTDDANLVAPGGPISDPALSAAVSSLAETARLCLLLRVVGGLPYSAIAQIAQVPEGTAMSHVHRSQRTLRQALLAHPSHGAAR